MPFLYFKYLKLIREREERHITYNLLQKKEKKTMII